MKTTKMKNQFPIKENLLLVFYFVKRVCKNENEALGALKPEEIWENYCRSNSTVHGAKSYYPK